MCIRDSRYPRDTRAAEETSRRVRPCPWRAPRRTSPISRLSTTIERPPSRCPGTGRVAAPAPAATGLVRTEELLPYPAGRTPSRVILPGPVFLVTVTPTSVVGRVFPPDHGSPAVSYTHL